MTGADNGDERLSTTEFSELIQHLPIQELFLIEYRYATGGWKKLFSRKPDIANQFTCLLCKADASCFKNLLAHISGRKHVQQMQSVKRLYHPEYTHLKEGTTEKSNAVSSSGKEEISTRSVNKTNGKSELKDGKEVLSTKDAIKTKSPILVKTSAEPQKSVSTTKPVNTEKKNKCEPTSSKAPNIVKNPAAKNNCESTSSKAPILVKNPAANNNSESTSKTAVLMTNTAAVTKRDTIRKSTNLEKTPVVTSTEIGDVNSDYPKIQYEQNRVIIPTKYKKDLQEPPPDTEGPLFTKTTSDEEVIGLLGVEYVIELLSENNCAVRYECGLCEKVLDAFAMQHHLEGYNHRLKYCEKHFPTNIKHYRKFLYSIPERDLFKILTPILAKLAIAIEKYHGRQTPYKCYEKDYILNRNDILSKVYSCQHASELNGSTLSDVVDAAEIKKYITEHQQYVPPTYSRSVTFSEDSLSLNGRLASIKVFVNKNMKNKDMQENNITLTPKTKKAVDTKATSSTTYTPFSKNKNYKKSVIQSKITTVLGKAPQITKHDRSFKAKPIPSHNWNLPVANPNLRHTNMEPLAVRKSFVQNPMQGMQEYVPSSMNASYVPHSGFNYHMQTPTNSSSSNDQRGGSVDDQTYNKMVDEFLQGTLTGTHGGPSSSRKRHLHSSHSSGPQPKLQHIKESDLSNLDMEFIKYRKDPETYPYYNDEWQQFWKRRKEELIVTGNDHRKYNYQPEWVKFIKYRIEVDYRERMEIIRAKAQERVRLSQASGSNRDQFSGSVNTNLNSMSNVPDKKAAKEAQESEVISVLRLMAALEENLGSLGPKIISLLSKALQLEKTHKGDLVRHLLNDDNCSVIETAKEKFKGLLLTGIIEGSKQRAMKKVVEDAQSLLDSAQLIRSITHSKPKHVQQIHPQGHSEPSITDILQYLRAKSDQK